MKKDLTNIWIGEQDLVQSENFIQDSNKELSLLDSLGDSEVTNSLGSNRRDFLKFLGFGLGAATIAAGCDIPVKKALPYVVKPDSIVPGIANYYASTYVNGGDCTPILVKTRDGRPIKVEANDLAANNYGKTSAKVQASVLSLYDTNRFTTPLKKGAKGFEPITWADLDKDVKAKLASATNIRILSNTNVSPTAKKVIADFITKYPSTKVVTVDDISYSAILDANEANFGKRALPTYKFDAADVIVSFNADFLGTWINPVKFAADYVKKRVIKSADGVKMSRHFQVESHMSLTGSNSDNRILVKPSEQGAAISYLYSLIVGAGAPAMSLNDAAKKGLAKAAEQLKAAAGRSLVVSGSTSTAEQMMVNAINNTLGNYSSTINMGVAAYNRQGSDSKFNELIAELNSGKIDVLILSGANPVYANGGATIASAISKAKTKIALSIANDETTALCDYIATVPHYLESWGDAQVSDECVSLIQPTIAPLFDSRQMESSLLEWSDAGQKNYYEYLKSAWQTSSFSKQGTFATFQSFWDNALHNGVLNLSSAASSPAFKSSTIDFSKVNQPSKSALEISFFEPVNIGNGVHSTNPWLQEMANPIDRTVWGNYLAVPVSFDGVSAFNGMNGLKDGDLVELTVGANKMTLPVIQQFGQMKGTVALALGYGRSIAGECGTNVGVNTNTSVKYANGSPQYYNDTVKVSDKIGKEKEFSCVQYHHTYGVKDTEKATGKKINADEAATVFFDYFSGVKGFQGAITDRSIIYTTNVKDLGASVKEVQEKRAHAQYLNSKQIYKGFDALYATGHNWGMHIDLNACIGCSACTVACMSENNVPIVGKKEVSRHHEMTWLRIDRYYYGNVENPNTVYQPMMCQHCDNAPCENVCPVNATSHSSEGLNQMTYNRCIGTRYCANNCPYKVRRFNWLDFTTADIFGKNQIQKFGEATPQGADNLFRMVLNPDVTVRTRGVIEKCSFCVQRIQEGKLTAKKEERQLKDGDIKTACQSACPTGAITFGDMNNKKTVLAEKLENPLNYIVLEEINVRSSVNYTMKVNNRDESLDA
jgi:Fe-S-cluster-containing dehydrogenase component